MEKRYNDSQVKAIGHFNGPCLTLAGPGSGKTAVITERTKKPDHKISCESVQYFSDYFYKSRSSGNEDPFLKSDGKRFVSGHIWNIPRRLF